MKFCLFLQQISSLLHQCGMVYPSSEMLCSVGWHPRAPAGTDLFWCKSVNTREHKGVRDRKSTSSTPTAADTFSAVCDAATRDNNDNISVRFLPRSSAELSNIWIDCVKAFAVSVLLGQGAYFWYEGLKGAFLRSFIEQQIAGEGSKSSNRFNETERDKRGRCGRAVKVLIALI